MFLYCLTFFQSKCKSPAATLKAIYSDNSLRFLLTIPSKSETVYLSPSLK